jgi:hypothetical protein
LSWGSDNVICTTSFVVAVVVVVVVVPTWDFLWLVGDPSYSMEKRAGRAKCVGVHLLSHLQGLW